MSDAEDFEGQAPYTITLKGGKGYDAPWLVLRAQSAEDAQALLVEAKTAELLESIAEYATDFQEKVAGAEPQDSPPPSRRSSSSGSSSRTTTTRRSAPPKNDDVEYHPEGLECGKCGKPVFLKAGTSRAGKKFEVWTCPNQESKGDGHFSEYV